MIVPDWIWIVFIFAFGCCIGSFLNVVIYRLPRDKSLIKPGSFCPACGKHICFYDNIPLVSWLLLAGKCRYCKALISPRYFIIEFLTGLTLVGLFIIYFRTDIHVGIAPFLRGGWFIYLIHIVMLAAFIAASAIDLEFWVIPLSICWLVTAVGFVSSAVGPYVIEHSLIRDYALLPSASSVSGSLAVGAAVGFAISWLLLATGLLRRSYESDNFDNKDFKINSGDVNSEVKNTNQTMQYESSSSQFNHRLEISREIIFLLPIILCSLAAFWFVREVKFLRAFFDSFIQYPFITGLLGGLWGYFVGCGVVWITRILGTLAFGKEAMGLGDVHLMGAAGAVIGPVPVVVAFFIAPFFGLAWAIFRMFFKKTRQIPYGPFLSLGVFTVMILHDWIFKSLAFDI